MVLRSQINDSLERYGLKKGRFLDAVEAAWWAHYNEYRRDGRPFLVHPWRVAKFFLDLGHRNESFLSALILHDTVENGSLSVDTISRNFGGLVGDTVDRMSKRKKESDDAYFMRVSEHRWAKLGKGADRQDNLSDLIYTFMPGQARRYHRETSFYILPLLRSTLSSERANLNRTVGFMIFSIEVYLGEIRRWLFGEHHCD